VRGKKAKGMDMNMSKMLPCHIGTETPSVEAKTHTRCTQLGSQGVGFESQLNLG
jgi:hypothetical protein